MSDLLEIDLSAPPPVTPLTGWPDLDDAAVRYRWFDGQAAATLAVTCPIVPHGAPGLPEVGPAFLELAARAGDPPAPEKVPGRKTTGPASWHPGPNFTAAVRYALYREAMQIPLYDKRGVPTQVTMVPGIVDGSNVFGPARTPLMVVGKCLGLEEMAERRPFVGRGSADLWRAWADAGLPARNTRAAYLTNLYKFRPPAWAESAMPADAKKDARYLLFHELLVCRPEWLWLLGGDAVKAVFGSKAKVSDFLGATGKLVLDTRVSADDPPAPHEVRVIATEHPAYIAREPQRYPTFLMGAKMLAEKSGMGRLPAAAPKLTADYRPVYTEEDLVAAVDEAVAGSANGGYVSVDCEWEGRHPSNEGAFLYTVQFSYKPGWARSVFVRRCGGAENPALPAAALARELNRLLAAAPARGARLVGHNLKADLVYLESAGCDLYGMIEAPADDPHADGSPGRLFGAQKTYSEGVFDTYVGGHAEAEDQDLKLEVFAATRLGADRWDGPVREAIERHLKETGKLKSQIAGYGFVEEEVIGPYGCADCDYSGRLYLFLNGDPRFGTRGALDADRYGQDCRQGYWVRMSGMGAWAEMERYGFEVDRAAHKRLRDRLAVRRRELLAQIRDMVRWPDFAPHNRNHVCELLFGTHYTDREPAGPPGAVSLSLEPFKATKAHGERLWADANEFARQKGLPPPVPACDQETLLARIDQHPVVGLILDYKGLNTALTAFFRPPDAPKDARPGTVLADATDIATPDPVGEDDGGEEADEVYSLGLLRHVCGDGRIRTMLFLAETGRLRSSAPNLQNCGSAADEKYARILGIPDNAPDEDKFITRSVFVAPAPTPESPEKKFVVTTDLKGAEIVVAAVLSGDELLVEHAFRSTLDESDPNYLDLHCDLAVRAFNLNCPPNKKAFAAGGYLKYRKAAKPARFGLYYGATAETIWRTALETARGLTLAEIEALIAAHDAMYPNLRGLFNSCRELVDTRGFVVTPCGCRRRFRRARDRDRREKMKREAQNFICQGPVADYVNLAAANVMRVRRAWGFKFRILLSVHDSLVLEVPAGELADVVDTLIPLCVTKMLPIVPCRPDGTPTGAAPFRFAVDTEVSAAWGVGLEESEWRPAAAAAKADRLASLRSF